MTEPCPISGAGHTWKLEPYERYISRGTCDCGAVKFFANDISRESIEKAELINKRRGKEGEQPGRAVARALATKEDNIIKKEATAMLEQDEKAKYEAMGVHDKGRWLKAHLEEIVADIRSLPRKEVLEKWPLGQSTLSKLTKLYAPEMIGKRGPKPQKDKGDKPPASTDDREDFKEMTEHEELMWLRGYRQGVLDRRT